jgi:23S rRNA (adenine2503-C2)-methyltransferase
MAPSLTPPGSPIERLPEEWASVLAAWGEPRYRANQVFVWIHGRGVFDPAAMTDLPASLRERLRAEGLASPLTVARTLKAQDGTEKLLFALADGQRIESVLIPRSAVAPDDVYAPVAAPGESGAGVAVTQCVSTQVGCAMGCVFCASGLAGLKRQLTASEIVGQVILARGTLRKGARLSGVVFMGMGEPLHNYDALARALVLLTHRAGIALSPRRLTVSTSGLVPAMERLGREFEGKVRLAVSLHAADHATRLRLMPVEKRFAIGELVAAMRAYPLARGARITVEYTLVRGVNDSREAAARLVDLLAGLRVKVNLIPMNPVPGVTLAAPDPAVADAFADVLRAGGIDTFVRRRRGDDIAAACGQLALALPPGEGPVPLRRSRASTSRGAPARGTAPRTRA